MKYQNLKAVFHQYTTQRWENEYEKRRNHYSTYNIDISIHPIQNQQQKKDLAD